MLATSPIQPPWLDHGDPSNFSDLITFTQNIPIEGVAGALTFSAQAGVRHRRLPRDQILWLVLGMALSRGESAHEVSRRLNMCAQGLASVLWSRIPGTGFGLSGQRFTCCRLTTSFVGRRLRSQQPSVGNLQRRVSTRLPVHSGATDRHGGGQSGTGNGKAAG